MPKRIEFSDRLTEHLATATQAELQKVSQMVTFAMRLRFGNIDLGLSTRKKRGPKAKAPDAAAVGGQA